MSEISSAAVMDIEDCAKKIMQGACPHEQWCFAFSNWLDDEDTQSLLTKTLQRWNTDTIKAADEVFLELIVADAMDAASIFLTDKPLEEAFGAMDTDKWSREFTTSLLKVNL